MKFMLWSCKVSVDFFKGDPGPVGEIGQQGTDGNAVSLLSAAYSGME